MKLGTELTSHTGVDYPQSCLFACETWTDGPWAPHHTSMMQGLSHTIATQLSYTAAKWGLRHGRVMTLCRPEAWGIGLSTHNLCHCGGHRPVRSPATPAKLCSGPLGQWVVAWASNIIVLPDPLKWTLRLSSIHALLKVSGCCSHKCGHHASFGSKPSGAKLPAWNI